MAKNSSHKIILIALISIVSISPSLGHKEKKPESSSEVEKYLRDITSKTSDPKRSWEIIKSELSQFNDTKPRRIADTIIVLAKTKGEEILDELNRLFLGSSDHKLVYKYGKCAVSYIDAIAHLHLARGDIGLNDDRKVAVEIGGALEELNVCEVQFGNDSFDPAHIRDRNRDFRVYLEIVKVATNKLLEKKKV